MKKNGSVAAIVMMMAFVIGLHITGLVPVLSLVSEKYADKSTSTIQLLQTIPYALLIAASLLVGKLSALFSKKKVILAGMLIVAVFGIIPFFFDGFNVLLCCRILIGFGFGIVSPMIAAVIAEFASDDKKAGMMGLIVVGMGIGAMIGNLLGGVLAGIGLRWFYLIYLFVFAWIILIMILLPDTQPEKKQERKGFHIKPIVLALSCMTLAHSLFFNAYGTNISLYISDRITADPAASGIATAVNSVFAMIVGLTFSKILNRFKTLTLPAAVLSAAAGFAAILWIPGMPGILLGSAFCGASLSCFSAAGAFMVTMSVDQDEAAGANGIYGVFNSLGGLVAPLLLGRAAILLGGNEPSNQFLIALVGMLLLAVVVWLHVRNKPV